MVNSRNLHKPLFLFTFLAISLMQSCLDNQLMTQRRNNGRFGATEEKTLEGHFKFRVCMEYENQKTDSIYTKQFEKYRESGFDVVWIDEGRQEILRRLAPIAEQVGLELDHKMFGDERGSGEHGSTSYADLKVTELSPKQFKDQIELAMANGAEGVSVFDGDDLTGEHLEVIAVLNRKNK